MVDWIKKNIIAIILIPFITGIWYNTRDVPDVKEKQDELKTELKEFKKEFADYKDAEWQRYVELNTKTFNLKK